MATLQCPHCRTVQLSPPHPGAACVHCRRPLAQAAQPQAPLPPHLVHAPPPPPIPPPVVRAPVDLKPKTAASPAKAKPAEPPPPPKEIVKRPPGRGRWLEIGLFIAVAALIGGGSYLAVAFMPVVDLSEKIAKQKEADVYIIPDKPAAPDAPPHWTDASRRAVRKQGFTVRVDRVLNQTVMARDASRQPIPADDHPHLQIHLNLRNDSAESKRYHPWFGAQFIVDGKRRGARLTDDLGREYPEATFPNVTEIQGVATEATLAPKEELRDTLIFDFPADTYVREVTHWRLTLPAAAADGSGVIRLEIPRKMLE